MSLIQLILGWIFGTNSSAEDADTGTGFDPDGLDYGAGFDPDG